MFSKPALIDTLGLGFVLWLVGYLSSVLLYFVLPRGLLGWVLFAIFTPVTAFVAYLRFYGRKLPFGYYLGVAVVWTAIAVVFDYVFIVVLLKPANYYVADVFLYYAATFSIPVGVGVRYAKNSI